MKVGVVFFVTQGLGKRFGLLRGDASELIAHGNIAARECVRPAQGAHGDVMSGPISNARNSSKALNGELRIVMARVVERKISGKLGLREGDNCFGASADDAEPRELGNGGGGETRRRGGEAIQLREWSCDGFA